MKRRKDKQIDRYLIDKQINKQIDESIDIQINRQIDEQIDKLIDRQFDTQKEKIVEYMNRLNA